MITKGCIYYSDGLLDPKIMLPCQKQLRKSFQGGIVNVSLKPIDFGDKQIVLPLERGFITMAKQILTALEASSADIVFHTEHDVLYHPSHFDFTPERDNTYYYNTNVWKLRYADGHTLYMDNCKQLSGMCAYRTQLIKHYKERLRRMELEGFTRRNGFEPGTRHISHGGYDDCGAHIWTSSVPNIDIRHTTNLSNNAGEKRFDWRWKKEDYKNKKYIEGWTEGDESIIPEWNIKKNQFKQFLSSI